MEYTPQADKKEPAVFISTKKSIWINLIRCLKSIFEVKKDNNFMKLFSNLIVILFKYTSYKSV